MKMNSEGSYFTPNDGSINDTIKVMEEIVKDIAEGNKISIGIDCNANNYYSDQVLKYEMDTFKAPIENDLLIDFYFKFINIIKELFGKVHRHIPAPNFFVRLIIHRIY